MSRAIVRPVYRSECDQYLARYLAHGGAFEAFAADGSIHWRHDNRIMRLVDRTRFTRPMVYTVSGYTGEQTGQKSGSFTLTLAHCDPSKDVIPWTGNTIIESMKVIFRRRIPRQNIPRWLAEGVPDGQP